MSDPLNWRLRRNRRPLNYYVWRAATLWIPLVFFLLFTLGPFWYMLVIALKDQQLEVNNPAVRTVWARVGCPKPDRDVIVLYPEKGGLKEVDEAEIERRYGIPGRAYADFAILRGDPSDGLPGVPGIGEKTAAGMVRRYGGLDGMLAALNWSPEIVDYVKRARTVVAPVTNIELPPPQPGLPAKPADPEKLEKLTRELGIEASVGRLLAALAANA